MTADKGWTIEYVMSLTYRQIGLLMELYWERKVWEYQMQLDLNPFVSKRKPGESPSSLGDGTRIYSMDDDADVDALIAKGIPIKPLVED